MIVGIGTDLVEIARVEKPVKSRLFCHGFIPRRNAGRQGKGLLSFPAILR